MKIVRLNPELTRESNHPRPGFKQYCFELDGHPDRQWIEIFNDVRAHWFSMRQRDVNLIGNFIFVDCTEGDLEGQLEDLKKNVQATNERFDAWKTAHDAEIARLQEQYRQEQERLKDKAGKLNFD